MLGRLLHLGSADSIPPADSSPLNSTHQHVSSLDSIHEDVHTRNLLFPDIESLLQNRSDQVFELSTDPAVLSANAFDFTDDVGLDVRDVRVLVMQDTLGPTQTCLLFDSHPTATPSQAGSSNYEKAAATSRPIPGKTASNPASRKNSLSYSHRPASIHDQEPFSKTGAFDQRTSLHNRSQSQAETEAQRAFREYRDELTTFSSCIFGNSELMAYKGTSTKVHVVPTDPRAVDRGIVPSVEDGRSSIGRSSMRSSKLSQSFTSQTYSSTQSRTPSASTRSVDGKKVLITRLFPVNFPNDELDSHLMTPPPRIVEDSSGFPFPDTAEEQSSRQKKSQPRQRRTPMYAVVLVVTLPNPTSRSYSTNSKPYFRGEVSSFSEQDFLPSSYNSARYANNHWTPSGPYDPADSSSSIDLEDRMDHLTQHWDIIMRTLTDLQNLTSSKLYNLLRQADIASPGPYPLSVPSSYVPRSPQIPDRRSADFPRAKPPKSTTKLVCVAANSLAGDQDVAYLVQRSRSRVVSGICAIRVVTGQGRWGIWRDEATWVSRWSRTSAATDASFLPRVFTGFLSTHLDWVMALCPPQLRRRALVAQRKRADEDLLLPSRTVVVSDNKMAARRLIFLLSAFLPASHHLPISRAHRPSTSAIFSPFGNSPPSFVVPMLREESLRRKINRRSGQRRHSRIPSQPFRASAVPGQLAHVNTDSFHERRASDAGSLRSPHLALGRGEVISRKSSAATTATVVPETTLPHFSSNHGGPGSRRVRHESSASSVTDDLMRSLRRSETAGNSSIASTDSRPPSSSRWGNLIGGFWAPRRRDSTDKSSVDPDSTPTSPIKGKAQRPNRLSEMVQELSVHGEDAASNTDRVDQVSPKPKVTRTSRDSFSQVREPPAQIERTPNPEGAFDSPVKTSINAEDGVIDVDVPFPDYITSFDSAISSPSSSGYLSTPGLSGGLDAFEQAVHSVVDGEPPADAAGWLNAYHPDFALQAVPPQEDLREQIAASLRADLEPLVSPVDTAGTWKASTSALIIDTRDQSIKRVTCRLRLRSEAEGYGRLGSPPSADSTRRSASSNRQSSSSVDGQIVEEWTEEVVLDAEDCLSAALGKILKGNFEDDRGQHRGGKDAADGRSTLTANENSSTELTSSSTFEVPRLQCKSVLLTALEHLIRDVDSDSEDQSASSAAQASQGQNNMLRNAVKDWMNDHTPAE